MTFDEEMRVIELKELSRDDERQVYTRLVCISFDHKNSHSGDYDSNDRVIAGSNISKTLINKKTTENCWNYSVRSTSLDKSGVECKAKRVIWSPHHNHKITPHPSENWTVCFNDKVMTNYSEKANIIHQKDKVTSQEGDKVTPHHNVKLNVDHVDKGTHHQCNKETSCQEKKLPPPHVENISAKLISDSMIPYHSDSEQTHQHIEEVEKYISVPCLVTSHPVPGESPQHLSQSGQGEWSSESPNPLPVMADYVFPLPRKEHYSLKSYLMIFLVIITLLCITLVVLCSQVTLPGRKEHTPLFKHSPSHQDSSVLELPNGNLVHYVGSKFMAPATEMQISKHSLQEQQRK